MSREEIIQLFEGRQDVYRFIGNKDELINILDCSYTTISIGGITYFVVNDDCLPPNNPRLELI